MTTDDINKCLYKKLLWRLYKNVLTLAGDKEEKTVLTDDEIDDVMTREEEKEDEREAATAVRTVGHNMAVDAFKVSFQGKKQKKIDSFFIPME